MRDDALASLKVGDLITYHLPPAWRDGGRHPTVGHARVTDTDKGDPVSIHDDANDQGWFLWADWGENEPITWIRGHHVFDSAEVVALCVADALR